MSFVKTEPKKNCLSHPSLFMEALRDAVKHWTKNSGSSFTLNEIKDSLVFITSFEQLMLYTDPN